MRTIVLLLFVVCSLQAFAQAKGRVIDAASHEPLAFVAVVDKSTNKGTYTDIDGYFELPLNVGTRVAFAFVGYESKEVVFQGDSPWQVALSTKPYTLSEVVIRAGENPAERIIKLAIANKDNNDPEKGRSFTYDSYNKLVFTFALDSAVANDPTKYNSLDSNAKQMVDYTNEQHLFLMESVSKRKFLPPGKSEETIIASRVSGLTNPQFALLSAQIQSFSFYGEMVNIFDLQLLSPLAEGSFKKYLFVLEDTTYSAADTVFTISFRPRKGKNFAGMKGQLFINTHGYAIQNVIAEPYDPVGGWKVKIQQQYEFVQGKKWFPMQLNSFIDMPVNSSDEFTMRGIGKSYIKNLMLDASLRSSEFTPVVLQMAPNATQAPDSVWSKYRDRTFDERDARTYHVVDSMGKAENFDQKLGMLSILSTGKLPWGKVSFDLDRLLRFNNYEGLRAGIGMHTNDRLSKVFSIGGYWGYGFRDKQDKYGGDLIVNVYRKRTMWLKTSYEHEVMEMGGNQLDKSGISLLGNANVYPLFISRMDRRDKYQVEFNGRVIGNLSANVFANAQRITSFGNYKFLQPLSTDESRVWTQYDVNEIGTQVRWAPGEKLARMGNREIRLGGRFPVVLARITKGDNFFNEAPFDYWRYDVNVEKRFRIKNVGDLTITAIAGRVEGNVPLSLLYNARGTNANFSIASPLAFETMRTNEFQHSEFAAVHIRHNFKTLLLKTKSFAPQFQLVHNMMWGDINNASQHSFAVQAVRKGFFESGLQIDGLLKSQFTALGIGTFYRYGPYALDGFKNNVVFKLTSVVTF